MSEQVEFNFKEEYIDSNEEGLSSFQADFIEEIQTGRHNAIFLNAPTGSGKTYSILLALFKYDNKRMMDAPHIIVAEPSNEIVDELYCNFLALNKSLRGKDGKQLSAVRITGRARSISGRQKEIRDAITGNNLVITNPDILSLYVAGNYLVNPRPDSTNFQDSLIQTSVIVLDEYHCYDPQSLGKILSIVEIVKSAHLDHLKFVFSSATPSERFINMVKKVLGEQSIKETSVKPVSSGQMSTEMRGQMRLILSDGDILDTIDDAKNFALNGRGTMAYIFNSVVDCERFADELKVEGIEARIINGYRKARRKEGEAIDEQCTTSHGGSPNSGMVIVATSTLELGVNIPYLSIGHIQLGYYFENLSQRLGRFSRRGQISTVYVHVSNEILNELKSIRTDRYYDFLTEVSKKISSRHIGETTVWKNSRIFAYCVWKHTKREYLKDRVEEAIVKLDGGYLFEANKTLKEISEDTNISPSRRNVFSDWWKNYFLSYGYFRGAISSVPVVLPDGTETSYDWIHIMRWADHPVKEENKYIIKKWREKGNSVKPSILFTDFRGSQKKFGWDDLKPENEQKFREAWTKDMEDALRNYLHIDEDRSKKYLPSLTKALYTITPRLLKPKDIEIEDNSDNIFI